MRQIRFGTDGVRGPYGEWPLTERGAHVIGRAVGLWANSGRVVVGRDTRQSSPALSDALCSGLIEGGATVLDGGVLPTAAVSCAVLETGSDAGMMITASHNPWPDNGVKILTSTGHKPSREEMAQLESLFGMKIRAGRAGRRAVFNDPAHAWRSEMPRLNLEGTRILIDCANGAASPHAPGVLESMGATVIKVPGSKLLDAVAECIAAAYFADLPPEQMPDITKPVDTAVMDAAFKFENEALGTNELRVLISNDLFMSKEERKAGSSAK